MKSAANWHVQVIDHSALSLLPKFVIFSANKEKAKESKIKSD